MNFTDFEQLARCHGVNIKSFRASKVKKIELPVDQQSTENSSVDYLDFKSKVIEICTSDKAQSFMVVNFSRKELGQTGDGHYR